MASVCNACRYFEGFCATFPALERRLAFPEADLAYLANLCHNCGSCYYACQYAPPHEFDVNVPRVMAQIRRASYQKYAWPGALARLYDRPGLAAVVLGILAPLAFALGITAFAGPASLVTPRADTMGSFYAVIPHRVMAGLFGAVGLFALAALAIGVLHFWRNSGERMWDLLNASAHRRAMAEALRLRYLGGGDADEGCTYPGERSSLIRRRFHHLTFYGFLLCFAATSVATVYHYGLGWHAPYPRSSLPVILGIVGGIGLLVGPAGLLWLARVRDPALADSTQSGLDVAFLVLLFLSAATGLALLGGREMATMGVLLAVHLGVVAALFLTMPYGKFVHGFYRYAALVRYAVESARPAPKFAAD
jgi:citrate/tricarballylate utilization protein